MKIWYLSVKHVQIRVHIIAPIPDPASTKLRHLANQEKTEKENKSIFLLFAILPVSFTV
jgi:hypothetical protein